MRSVASLISILFCICQTSEALQMILASREPMCVIVTPKRLHGQIDISYTISGINEDQVTFTVTQDDKELSKIDLKSQGEFSWKPTSTKDCKVCWQKIDRKSKKVSFLITQWGEHLEQKAGVDTIERITESIEALQYKLDQISMNIVAQVETEKVHFEITQDTTSQQTWMNVLKILLVLAICAGQVYMTMSYFNKGNTGSRRNMQNDINPFAKSSI